MATHGARKNHRARDKHYCRQQLPHGQPPTGQETNLGIWHTELFTENARDRIPHTQRTTNCPRIATQFCKFIQTKHYGEQQDTFGGGLV